MYNMKNYFLKQFYNMKTKFPKCCEADNQQHLPQFLFRKKLCNVYYSLCLFLYLKIDCLTLYRVTVCLGFPEECT